MSVYAVLPTSIVVLAVAVLPPVSTRTLYPILGGREEV
jgi:hypothetical protein